MPLPLHLQIPTDRTAGSAFWLEHAHWLAVYHRVAPLHSKLLQAPSDDLVRHLFAEHYHDTRVPQLLGEALSCKHMWRTLCFNLSPVEPTKIVRVVVVEI